MNPFDQQKFFSEYESSLHGMLRFALNNDKLDQFDLESGSYSEESTGGLEESGSELVNSEQSKELMVTPNGGAESFIAMESKPHELHKMKPKGHKTAVELQHEREVEALKTYIKEALSIPVGSWLEFTPAAGARLRCKLAEKLDDTKTFVFVNRLGQKVLEQQLKLMAQELKKKRVRVIDNRPLFDRALDAVVGKLKRSKQQKADSDTLVEPV